jgi:hypothetical protein
MTGLPSRESLDAAIEETIENLRLSRAYSGLSERHLEIGDFSGALWDMVQFIDTAHRVERAFAPIRERMKGQSRPAMKESAE